MWQDDVGCAGVEVCRHFTRAMWTDYADRFSSSCPLYPTVPQLFFCHFAQSVLSFSHGHCHYHIVATPQLCCHPFLGCNFLILHYFQQRAVHTAMGNANGEDSGCGTFTNKDLLWIVSQKVVDLQSDEGVYFLLFNFHGGAVVSKTDGFPSYCMCHYKHNTSLFPPSVWKFWTGMSNHL